MAAHRAGAMSEPACAMRPIAEATPTAADTGSPATTAPAVNTSGYAARHAAAIEPPADSPTTNTRRPPVA